MLGALYGDVIGSYYEVHCTKDYNFEFKRESTFTDDSVMTVAVCDAILANPNPITAFGVNKRGLEYAGKFKQYYSYHPNAGFGGMFRAWAKSDSFKKSHSYGNGAAMRAVPIGYAYDSLEQVMLQAKASCVYTHNNKEAIKAAQAVASAVFLARNGADKSEIKKFLSKKFGYYLDMQIDAIREVYEFNCRCSYSVPPSIIAFLESTDYESAVRNAVSIGGDADTQACIAGGIAEAYYKEIPEHIDKFCRPRIDYSLKQKAKLFREKYCI